MVRVLHSVSNMDRAGIETMLMNYYRHMDQTKVQFDFLCSKKKPGAYDEEIQSLGGKIYHTPGLNPLKFFKYQKYMNELFFEHPEYQILHAHNGALGVYALFGAKKNNIPHRIFHAHGASISFDLKWPLKMFCKFRLQSNCNRNWTCGVEAAKYYFGKKNVQLRNYCLVQNAIEVDKFSYKDEVRSKLRENNRLLDKIVIGHVGRFMAQKNHTFLIDIFKEIHNMETRAVLLLVGDGELMDKMREKVRRAQLGDYVRFIGNVGNVNEWYQAFDAFVLPSIWEGLPVVGVEAQTASLPCFFSDSITNEVGVTRRAQFISLQKDPKVWAQKILSITLQNTREDMSKTITDAGYNIRIESKKLQRQYEDFMEELHS